MEVQPAALTAKQAAIYLGVTEGTLAVWRSERRYPGLLHLKVGGRVQYRKADLDMWLEKRTVGAQAVA